MSNRTPTSVIAFYQQQQTLQAVELRRHGETYDVLWRRQASLSDTTWADFAEACGVRLSHGEASKLRRGQSVVMGLSSVGVASYRLELPAVGEAQLKDMIRLQSEPRLPLPLEQMELGWHRIQRQQKKTVVTVAAARRQRLTTFSGQAQALQAQTLFLDSEALVCFAKHCANNIPDNGVLVAMNHHVTMVCRLEGGQHSQTILLDVGRDDLFGEDNTLQMSLVESFAGELKRSLEMIGGGGGILPIL